MNLNLSRKNLNDDVEIYFREATLMTPIKRNTTSMNPDSYEFRSNLFRGRLVPDQKQLEPIHGKLIGYDPENKFLLVKDADKNLQYTVAYDVIAGYRFFSN